MYLKRIEINGFKSFAKKTSIDFLASNKGRKSITAIVGPNGSGKSNISDAIKWVMGEQSMKHLRSKKSADVIFSGSDTKGQLSMASVALIIDNSDKRVDIEFDELIIARKLYRTGESEYSINGKKVRLIDVQILLAKAQFGHGSYSVVGQGMIDRLLLQSAEDRKSFFDEAVGIKEFQMKRRQSWLKLLRSKEHVSQANLLLQEITPRLKSLSRQVKKLEQRQEIEISLREARESFFATMYKNYTDKQTVQTAQLTEASKKYNSKKEELETVQVELATIAKQASRSEIFGELQKKHDSIVRKKNELERQKSILQGKIQTEYSRQGKQQLSWLEAKVPELTAKKDQLVLEIETTEKQQKTIVADVEKLKNEIDDLLVKRVESKTQLAKLQQQLLERKGREHVWQFGGLRALEGVLSNQRQFGTVHGAVAQLGSVEKEFQLALDIAAGGQLTSLVVQDDTVAKNAIAFLRRERLGIATFLPLNKIRPRIIPYNAEQHLGIDGVIGFALDLITYDDKFEDVFSFVFGSTLIVKSMDVARRVGIGKIRMVTLEGDIVETSGQMKGGYRKRREHGLSFSQKRIGEYESVEASQEEIEAAQKDADRAEISIMEKKSLFAQLEMQLAISKEGLTLKIEQQQKLEGEIASLEQEKALNDVSPDEYSLIMKNITAEKINIEKEIEILSVEVEKVQKNIEQFNQQEEQKKNRVFELQDVMQSQQQELQAVGEAKHLCEVELAKLETKLEDLENDAYHELKSSISSIIEKGVEYVALELIEPLQQQIQKLSYKLSLIGGIDEEVIEEHRETKIRHDELSGQITDLDNAIRDLEKLIVELDAIMKKKHNESFKLIKKEFARYFSILFDGGKADLIEVYGYEKTQLDQEDEDNESEEVNKGKKILKGIDIVACPPGKKIKNIGMLSGGERTMTSIALICAILQTNPAPFVVFDEVEAALDEANSNRLNSILQELASNSQFILITHNRATMHSADTLYGVTMGVDGMSRLVSVDMSEKN